MDWITNLRPDSGHLSPASTRITNAQFNLQSPLLTCLETWTMSPQLPLHNLVMIHGINCKCLAQSTWDIKSHNDPRCQIAKVNSVIHVGFIVRGSFHWQSFSVCCCCPQFRWFNFHPSSISRKLFENNNPKLIPFIPRVINMFNLIPSKRISYNWHNDWYIIYVKNLTIMWTQKDIFPNGNKFSNRRLCAF